jgi:hypothetical protein
MDKLLEAFAEMLFESPVFKEKLNLFLTEFVSDKDEFPSADEVERIVLDALRNATVSVDVQI